MQINFENLEKIEEIHNLLLLIKETTENKTEKRWLNANQVAEYTGFSQATIKNLIKEKRFKIGIHFHQKIKINTFDKQKIDEWMISNDQKDLNKKNISRSHKHSTINNVFDNVLNTKPKKAA